MSVTTFRNAVKAELVRRSAPGFMAEGPESLALFFQEWSQFNDNEKLLVRRLAEESYAVLSDFVNQMNPYGNQPIFFPTPRFNSVEDRTELDALREDTGIEVAGWLALNHADAPEPDGVSSSEMTEEQVKRSFHWEFPDPEGLAEDPRAVQKIQITKAIKIPFLYYQQKNNRFLLAELLIGYGGAGGEG